MAHLPTIEGISKAHENLKKVISPTILQKSIWLSEKYHADIYLKREDLQCVRSYKIRGAYNKILSLNEKERKGGVVCASAGNHAQGVAYSANLLSIFATIFVPRFTPLQKQQSIQMFGKAYVNLKICGDTFDETNAEAQEYAKTKQMTVVPPFDDLKVIEGQGTVAHEIINDANFKMDYLLVPVGGGGLISGMGIVFQEKSPHTKIIGLEPKGAPAMKQSLKKQKIITLDKIDCFVDGAAVKSVGKTNFSVCQNFLKQEDIYIIPEGKTCSTILELYNREAIVVEPAGALSIAALDLVADEIKGKNVVCVVSGGNNDIGRMEEIKERSLLYEGLKHYFIVDLPQRAGALIEFLNKVLEKDDDIVYFEYIKKINRAKGPILVGIETKQPNKQGHLISNMERYNYEFTQLKGRQLRQLLI